MKQRLLSWLRCPSCRSSFTTGDLRLESDAYDSAEIVSGVLACKACPLTYEIEEGIPRLLALSSLAPVTRRTSQSFGYLWTQSSPEPAQKQKGTYHFERMASSVGVRQPQGLVLDAGCGEGIDLVNQARKPNVEIVGVDLSFGGCRTSRLRSRGLANAHVVQADLSRLPFDDGQFDYVYSYGVLHHMANPQEGLLELVRVLKPGGRCMIYLYEDLSERPRLLRGVLAAANSWRGLTTRLPPAVLYRACQIASPVIFFLFAAPQRLLRRIRPLRGIAEEIPFRHAQGPFRLAGDLYDRFSAPVERRYSRSAAEALLRQAGAENVAIAFERGWVVTGIKPIEVTACAG